MRLKQLIADMFRMDILEPHKIAGREMLIGGRLGLDAEDVRELSFCIEEVFGVTICRHDGSLRTFASITNLADFILERMQTTPAGRPSPKGAQLALEVLMTSPSPI